MDKDIYYCRGYSMANYLIKHGCIQVQSSNTKYPYAFKIDDNLITLLEQWSSEKKKFFF